MRLLKVALIGDVHANLPALEAVLAHAAGQGVETIWNVGAFPDEVVTELAFQTLFSRPE